MSDIRKFMDLVELGPTTPAPVQDTEDYALLHVVFEDGMVADVMASELVLGGIYDFIEVFANNHRTRCRMSPVSVGMAGVSSW